MWWERFVGLFGREKRPALSREASREGVPVVRPGIRVETGPSGERVLFVPRRSPFKGFLRRIFPGEPAPAKFFLDEIGGTVFGLIDGERTVGELMEETARRYCLHPREAETSVVEFLNMLMRRGIVVVAFHDGESAATGAR